MFKIAKKNLILKKIDAFFKKNSTCHRRLRSFFEFFRLLLRIFIII